VLVLFCVGTSLITPLIPLYQDRLGFGQTTVTLFFVCYVVTLVPSMLTMGQVSDQIGRRPVVLAAVGLLAVAQVLLLTEPGLEGLLVARGLQGAATGAFSGTCTAYLLDAAPAGRRREVSTLASISVRLGLGLGPGVAGVLAEYSGSPLRAPFEVHLACLAAAGLVVAWLPETVARRPGRPRVTLSLGVPPESTRVFWRVLVPSGVLFALFEGVSLGLIPVFLVRELDVTNYAVVGLAGFLVMASGALSQVLMPRLAPGPAIRWGLVLAAVASAGVVAGRPTGSAPLVLVAVAVTGGACGLVFKGGVELCARIAPEEHRGRLVSAYFVACYLGGFSVPLLAIGLVADAVGLTPALATLTAVAALGAAWTGWVGLRDLPPREDGVRRIE
jgi:MFS family permease